MNLRDRCRYVLKQEGVSVSELAGGNGTALQAKVNRQINGDTAITSDVIALFLERFDNLSADWLLRDEGTYERTKIVTPPTNRQDIHVEQGATAAISQSGSASATPAPAPADEKKSDTFTYEDVARMVRDNDLGGLVGIIFAQQQTIIRYEQQRNADLLREMHMVDSKLFPGVH